MFCLFGVVSLNGEQCVDVCVIGVGFIGFLVVFYLLEVGCLVCVLEVYEVGYGGLGCNVGLINVGIWIFLDEVVVIFGVEQGEKFNVVLGWVLVLVMEIIECFGIDCQLCCEGILYMLYNVSGVVDL